MNCYYTQYLNKKMKIFNNNMVYLKTSGFIDNLKTAENIG